MDVYEELIGWYSNYIVALSYCPVYPFVFSFVLDNEKEQGSDFLKPSTNRMLTRIKSVYMFISNNGTVSTQELVEEFGITPRTIQRDLNVLAYNDLVKSPSRGVWTTTSKRVKISS